MAVSLGAVDLANCAIGSTQVERISVGDVLVWQNYQEAVYEFVTAGATNTPIPSWVKFIDLVLIGGGKGGSAGNGGSNVPGRGGAAASWQTTTWDIQGSGVTTLSMTVGAGGSGGQTSSQAGGNGGSTTAATGVHSLTSAGATGLSATNRDGDSAGNITAFGITFVGGVGAPGGGSAGGGGSPPSGVSTPPGAGGPGGWGGIFNSYQQGGPGARGQAWVRFRSA
ncbi:hypothetical protein SEA_EVAA_37 [Gordonia phage Evaa]|nr:hypothetical protein SEA_EVAA_37 [Gordonia phage Evaa]